MANVNAQSLSAWLGRSIAPFFQCVKCLFHTIYNEPVAEDMEHYALSSAFCVC